MGDVLQPAVAGFVQGVAGDPMATPPAQVPQPGSTPAAAPAAAPATESLMTPSGVQPIPEHILAARLAKAGEKARAETLEAIGFKSVDDAKAAFARWAESDKKAEAARLATLTETQRLDEERRKAREEADTERKARVEREAELEKLRREAEMLRYESRLNEAALTAGVKQNKLKYARFAFQEAVSGKDKDEHPDPLAWFRTNLRQMEPDIFADAQAAVQQQAALQTGPSVSTPTPAAPAKTEPPTFDALKATPEEWAKFKQDEGL